jgi:tungstate transport system substrate-binding protein
LNASSTLRPGASIWVTCALAAASVLAACSSPRPATLEIATTSSVQNSGLLDVLLPAYKTESGIEVRVHAAGSGRALQMLDEGLARLVISHAPAAEAIALRAHPGWVRQRLAHNWFVVVGPERDPAAVRTSTDVVDAFRRIKQAGAVFVSRGDESGTHEREKMLWELVGAMPVAPQYVTGGRGMSLALRHADELEAYTLSDEATFLQLAPEIDLVFLYRGDERLRNVYSVIHPRPDEEAARLAEWLVAGHGRDLIGAFTVAGTQVFSVDER